MTYIECPNCHFTKWHAEVKTTSGLLYLTCTRCLRTLIYRADPRGSQLLPLNEPAKEEAKL